MNSNNNITSRSNLFFINNCQNKDCNGNFYYKNDFESRSLSKFQFVIPHNESLICFQKCSKWIMTISTKNSNFITINGKIIENPQNTYISQNFRLQTKNLESYFPIDMGAYKIFNIYGSAKYPLNLGFCINTSKISKVDERFYKSNFHIEINGILSHINKNVEIFKVPENFTATGMEIVQRIKEHLSYIVNYNINTPSNNNYYEFTIPIFKDGTFYVSFSISKKSFLSYINSKSKIFYDLFKYEVKITKLFFNYGIPLIIFCQQMPLYKNIQINNTINNNININKLLDLKEEKLSDKMLLLDEFEKNMPENYCNFRRFLTNITPIIYEFDNLKIKNIFDIFIKPSLYGCSVLYKNFSNLIYVNYFPSLNKVYIEHNFCLSHNTTIDSSFSNNSMYKTINFEENEDEIYWKKSYSEQIESLFNNFKEIDDLELGDISNNSYFSIIWIPFQKNYNNFCSDKLENSLNISFEIYYAFKLEHNNSGHKMKIIGLKIRDKNGMNIKDSNKILFKNQTNFNNENYFFINSHTNELNDINEEEKINFLEYFWFMNKSIDHFNSNSIGYSYEQMEIFNYNKYIFNLLKTHN